MTYAYEWRPTWAAWLAKGHPESTRPTSAEFNHPQEARREARDAGWDDNDAFVQLASQPNAPSSDAKDGSQ